MEETYDVVVVGGGAAGLSGAVALARSRRSVLVLDPRNAPAGQVHNFLTRDGTPPAEIYAIGRGEVSKYGGHVETGWVTTSCLTSRASPRGGAPMSCCVRTAMAGRSATSASACWRPVR
jgi:thioredoxin reductase